MPSTYAHKKFGALVYHRLPKDIKSITAQNYEYFLAGLHGPDVLFFHKPGFHGGVSEIGKRMHKASFEEMYCHAVRVLLLEPEEEKLAYFTGCICHFMLDSACHPIVRKAVDETGMTHGKIEVEFDRYLLMKDGKEPLQYPLGGHIPVMMNVAEAAAAFYPGVSAEDFLVSLMSMKAVVTVCGSNRDAVRHTVCKVMEKTGHEDKIASLVMSRQKSIMVNSYTREMYKKLLSEADTAVNLIARFTESYDMGYETPERFCMNFNGERK